MKRKNVLLFVVLVLCLAVSSVACSNEEGSSTPSESVEPTNTATSKPDELEGTIEFWSPYNESQGMGDLIAGFNEIYPNVTVNLSVVGNNDDGNAKIDTALMAGGGLLDVFTSFNNIRTNRRVQGGLLKDITDLCASDGIDLIEEFGGEIRYDGRLYALPNDGLNNYIAINMTKWNEAGLGELPTEWTWDEYIEACRKMTKDGVYGGSGLQTIHEWTYSVIQNEGGDVEIGEDGLTTFVSNPAFKTALERKVQCEVEEKIWYPLLDYRAGSTQTKDAIIKGNAASGVVCNINRFIADKENYPIDFIMGFAPYPVNNKGEANYIAGPSIYGSLCMSEKTENVEAVWEFMKYYAFEGSKSLFKAGHLPTWKKTDPDEAVEYIFGSASEAAELIDVESFKRVVLNYEGDTYLNEYLGIYDSGVNEITLLVLNGEMTVDEGLQEMKDRADKDIQKQE